MSTHPCALCGHVYTWAEFQRLELSGDGHALIGGEVQEHRHCQHCPGTLAITTVHSDVWIRNLRHDVEVLAGALDADRSGDALARAQAIATRVASLVTALDLVVQGPTRAVLEDRAALLHPERDQREGEAAE